MQRGIRATCEWAASTVVFDGTAVQHGMRAFTADKKAASKLLFAEALKGAP